MGVKHVISPLEESRLRVSDTQVMKEIFGPQKEEVIKGWGKLHNDELPIY
jgi:hypothetical protein